MLEILGHKTKSNLNVHYYEMVDIPGYGKRITRVISKNAGITQEMCFSNPVLGVDTQIIKTTTPGFLSFDDCRIDRETEGLVYSYLLNPIFRTTFILNERGHIDFPRINYAEFIPTSQVQILRSIMRTNQYRILENNDIEGIHKMSMCNGKMSIRFEEDF